MANAKVTLNGTTLIDLTSDTVIAAAMLSGVVAHASDGNQITGTIISKDSATYTPGTAEQVIGSGQYLTGVQTIAGDSNLIAANIASGVTIFGIIGTHQGGAAYDVMNAEEIYAAAASGWGSTNPSLSAAIWSSVAAGWSVSSTVTDGQIEAAVSAGWR